MRELKGVQGSMEQAQPIVVGYDTVYVHSNIHKIEGTELYEYDEVQYDKDEYIKYMADRQSLLEECLLELGDIIYM